jgi:hypothetical protein
MESTTQIVNRLNKRLTQNLIPDKSDPIYCNNILDSNKFDKPINTIDNHEEDFEFQKQISRKNKKR